ncbi:TonB-dependent receptor [Ulvibacter antarcticus]|uniref:Iron complex outermembrane receptor protein n=1 Tax=Ulvibacter antarcticus TaxID=442714 RepID=A0A3L9YUT3_9FLAO|nr:TonB-dependent receptor [Ulvibacter antarcticus]RMA64501.1 iron complex outermembrane receptor protein [Ulvibacter antarcticus]
MKYLYALLLGIILFSEAQAQNTFTGNIQNKLTNEPLIATVYIPKLEKGTIADLDGNFIITNIPNGDYTVIVSLLGYKTTSEEIRFSNDKQVIENFFLVESAVEMEEIIVSTPFHKLQSDNVMKVDRVTVDALSSQGAVTLSEGIANMPGVNTISTGIGIGKPVIRGLSSNRVLTYTQGIRLENQQFGDEHGLGINESGIESVEVIKGPASLLYGSDALGGVLYLNPERFAPNDSVVVSGESRYFSNTSGSSSNLGVKLSGNKFKFLARASYGIHSDYKSGSGYRVTNTRFEEKDLKTGVGFQNTSLKSSLRYNYNRSLLGIPEEIGIQSRSKELIAPYQAIDAHILSSENRFFLKNSSLDAKFGYSFNNRKEYEALSSDPELHLKLSTLSYDVKYNLPKMGRFETIAGIQGIFQKNTNFGEEFLIPNAKVIDFGIFGTTHYHLEKVDFQAGLRFDTRKIRSEETGISSESNFIPTIDRSFSSITAAFGAKTDITNHLVSRVNLASGFRSPNLAELASNGVHEGTIRYEKGNASLQNEQNFQADFSLEFRNEHIEISASSFYNSIRDYIFLSPSEEIIDGYNVFNYLQNNANLYGGEIGIHFHPHPIDWLHFESSFELVRGELDNGGSLPLLPADALKNTLRAELTGIEGLNKPYIFITYQSTFAQKRPSIFETTSKAYNLLSAGFGSDFKIRNYLFHFGITASNLTNEKYISHLSRLKQEGIENIGRNISFKVKFTI